MAHIGYGFARWQRERARDEAVTPNVLDDYFNELKEILEKYKLMNSTPSIWNVDETGISLDHNLLVKEANILCNSRSFTYNYCYCCSQCSWGKHVTFYYL
ncbi:hypothetical protein KUTeg_024622 [Tegillarca granosa]|uniref:Transposase n=1 Tax=Tegillarca granosa TaxID=220873 RepID=A0ABQ9E2Z8_TEGGR|nr:hypothetical protein KUTeg_024622 [Tegillarca granosa]